MTISITADSVAELLDLAVLMAPRSTQDALITMLDQVLTSLTSISQKEDTAMSIENDLVAAVAAEKNETAAATMALQALEGQIAALKAQAATPGIDPAVIQQAITDLGADTVALAAAIPADAVPPAPVPTPVPVVPTPTPVDPTPAPAPFSPSGNTPAGA